jgi:hypothetical protein
MKLNKRIKSESKLRAFKNCIKQANIDPKIHTNNNITETDIIKPQEIATFK